MITRREELKRECAVGRLANFLQALLMATRSEGLVKMRVRTSGGRLRRVAPAMAEPMMVRNKKLDRD